MKIKSVLERLPKSTIKLTITVTWSTVKEAYGKTLEKITSQIKLPGFRKGKASKKAVEEKVGKPAIYQEMLQNLLSQAYREAIQKHQLKPIISPQIKPLKTEENKDWQFEAITAEKPEVKLGDYQEKIKQELSAAEIWVPGKEEKKEDKKNQQQAASQKLNKALSILLKTVKMELSPVLIQAEADRALSQLLEEIKKLGLNLDAYLSSINKTAEQLRQEQQAKAERNLKLEFVLNEVADDLKIKVEEKEIDQMIEKAAQSKAERKKLANQKYYLASVLRRQKTIDKLVNL